MLKPTGNRIVVRLDENLPTGIDGFVLPPKTDAYRAKDGAVEGMNRGTVVAVGPGMRHPKTDKLIPMSVQLGDVVRFSELQFHTFTEDGHKHVLISEMDVLGVEMSHPAEAIRSAVDEALDRPTALTAAIAMVA
jgi:co-chaperonin GroES (HSP10)